MTPQRIQLSRAKDWRKPPDAVVVARPRPFGNPWVIQTRRRTYLGWEHDVIHATTGNSLGRFGTKETAARYAVLAYHRDLAPELAARIPELAGHPLACWCPLERPDGRPWPCHALYLALCANQPDVDPWTHCTAVTAW